MAERRLQLVVLTPHGRVLDEAVSSVRVPTDTGQVGLRPRSEPAALVVEPGLVLVSTAGRPRRFVATVGGLLRCEGTVATLLTPLALAGDDAVKLQADLGEALAAPSTERELRAAIQQLQASILQEIRGVEKPGAARV